LEDAKDWLSVEDDNHVSRLIKSAVDWVERYTGYRMYVRPETFRTDGCGSTLVSGYPVEVVSVVDKNGVGVNFCEVDTPSGTVVKYGNGAYMITVNVGYRDVNKIPSPLIDAAYKIMTYLHENRDMYPVGLPTDVQFLLNKYRRTII